MAADSVPALVLRDAILRIAPQTVCPSSYAEATHPRCECEGYLDRPGRASRKEGESWKIIAKLSLVSIHRSCVTQLRLRMPAGVARFGSMGRSRTHRPQRPSSFAS